MSGTAQAEDENIDTVWGAAAIGREIGLSREQFYYWYRKGLLDGVVAKVGPKTFVSSRQKLRALFSGNPK